MIPGGTWICYKEAEPHNRLLVCLCLYNRRHRIHRDSFQPEISLCHNSIYFNGKIFTLKGLLRRARQSVGAILSKTECHASLQTRRAQQGKKYQC